MKENCGKKAMKVKNIEDLYTRAQFEKVAKTRRTYDSGYSPIALSAPDQVSRCGNLLQYDFLYDVKTSEYLYTLKFYYALLVWRMTIGILNEKEACRGNKLWSIRWVDNDTPFRLLKFNTDIYQDNVKEFWNTLKDVTNSQVIKVCEGMTMSDSWHNPFWGDDKTEIKINTQFIIDAKNVDEIDDKRRENKENLYSYSFSKAIVSYKWDDIKDFFIELTLEEIALANGRAIHKKQTETDKQLYDACGSLDMQAVKDAIANGANVNSLSEYGDTAITRCIEATELGGMRGEKLPETEATWEERLAIKKVREPIAQEIISYLLEKGADIDLFGFDGTHPLTESYLNDSIVLMKFLLEKGANPNYNEFITDFYDERQTNIASAVLAYVEDYYGEHVSKEFSEEMLQLLKKYGAKYKITDKEEKL